MSALIFALGPVYRAPLSYVRIGRHLKALETAPALGVFPIPWQEKICLQVAHKTSVGQGQVRGGTECWK